MITKFSVFLKEHINPEKEEKSLEESIKDFRRVTKELSETLDNNSTNSATSDLIVHTSLDTLFQDKCEE